MSHHVFEATTGMAPHILETTHYVFLCRANDPFALFSKMSPANVQVAIVFIADAKALLE